MNLKPARYDTKRRVLAYAVVLAMLFSYMFLTPLNTYSYEDKDMGSGPDSYQNDGGENEDDDDYSLSISKDYISFGTVTKNTGTTEYQGVSVRNTGSKSVELTLFISDAERVFLCDCPNELSLAPGQECKFYFAMDTNHEPGRYTAEFMAASINDPDFENGVFLDMSGTIENNSPRVSSVTVKPGSVQLARGASYQFGVDVVGDNLPDSRVNWRLEGNTSSRTNLSNSGYLYVSDDENADNLRVIVTSEVDSGKSDTAYVTVAGGNYTVTTRSNPSDGGTTGGGGTVSRGSNISVMASSNNGYSFVNWTLDGREVSTSPKYVLDNIRQNYDLVANFRQTSCYVKVKVNHPEGGSVTDSTNVSYNGSLTLNANPKSGFSFEGWYENGKRIFTSNSLYITGITTNREITANFVQDIFSVDVKCYPGGAGSVSGSGNYKKGANVSISARPVDGYEFVNWTCNNNEICRSLNFTLTNVERDCVLVANFQKKKTVTYEINAVVASGRGTISPSGKTKVQENGNIIYTIAPASGYVISAVAVDGVQKGSVSTFSFSNVTSNHSIAVAFDPINTPKATASPSQVATPMPTLAPNIPVIDDPNKSVPTKSPENGSSSTSKTSQESGTSSEEKPSSEEVTLPSEDEDSDFNQEGNVEPEAIGNPDGTYNLDSMTGILQKMNITPSMAREYIKNGQSKLLLDMACEEQYLGVTVHNEFASTVKETETTSFSNVASVPNLQDVIDRMLSEDEKIYVLEGNSIKVNLSIFDISGLETPEVKEIEKYASSNKISVGKNFEVILMETIEGNSRVITNTEVPAQIVLNVPRELRSAERQFCIIRSHKETDGSLSVDFLRDEDDNPDTITFSTGKFSSYAIGYAGGEESNVSKTLVIVGLMTILVVAVVLTIAIGLILWNRRKRKHKKYMKRS